MYQSLCYSKRLRISRETPKKICSIFELTISMFVCNKLQCIRSVTETDVKRLTYVFKTHLKTFKAQKQSRSKEWKEVKLINDNECDDSKKDCKIVTIRTRFGFWYQEEVDGSVELEAELRLEPEDQVVVVAGGGRQVSAECGL